MDDIAYINPTDPPLDADAPFVPMDAIAEWQRTIERVEKRGNRNGVRARAGDVLMARITPCLENGKIAQVPDSIPRCGGSTEFIVFRPKKDSNRSYLYWVLTSDRIRNTAVALMSGTTGRQRVSGTDLSDILIPELSEKQRQQMGELIDSIEQSRIELVKRLRQARTLHFALLNSLVGGGVP
jgi:type I restriction enzyme S subunit